MTLVSEEVNWTSQVLQIPVDLLNKRENVVSINSCYIVFEILNSGFTCKEILFFHTFPILKKTLQSKLFIMSLVITEYSISDINLLGTDLFLF